MGEEGGWHGEDGAVIRILSAREGITDVEFSSRHENQNGELCGWQHRAVTVFGRLEVRNHETSCAESIHMWGH